MSLPDELRDGKIGRFPIWAVGVLLAGAIILFLFIRNRNRQSSSDPETDVPGYGAEESVAGIPTTGFADQISGNFPSNVSLAPLPQRPILNAQWLIAAFDFLVGLSKNPTTVQRALQKYLAGAALTEEERSLVELALQNSNLGLPPEGVNLPPGTQQPPPSNDPPPDNSPTHATAPANTNLYDWASPHGGFVKLFGMYKNDPRALNPSARSYMTWSGPSGSTKIPTFKTARTIRIR